MEIKLKSLGSDPELFLYNNYGSAVSSIGKVGGTKENPKPLGNGYYVQEDNVLIEYNIPPCASVDDFSSAIATGLQLVRLSLPPGYDVRPGASELYDESELQNPRAKSFGCSPDIDAWTGEEKVASVPDYPIRTAGGHLHIGYEPITLDTTISLVKAHDIFLGLPSVILDPDNERRSIYGSAGSFRVKPYGFEYRTLSSFWLKEEKLVRWVYRSVEDSFEFVNSGGVIPNVDALDIITAINFGDQELAHLLISKYNVKLP